MGKLKKLLLGMVFGLFFISSVHADTLNNLSVSVEHESGFENSYMDLYLKITADEFSNNTYKSLITKNTDDVSETIADSSTLISMTSSISQPTFFKVAPVDYINYASKYGDLYLTLYEYDGEKYNKVSDSLLVKRPTLLNYGSRIDASFYDDKSISLNFNEMYNEESSIKIKIGSIDSFKGSSYDELVDFAKNDSGIFNKTIALNSYNDNYDTWGKYQNVYDNTNIALKDGILLIADKLVWAGNDVPVVASGNVKIKRNKDFYATASEAIINPDYQSFKINGNTESKIYEVKE